MKKPQCDVVNIIFKVSYLTVSKRLIHEGCIYYINKDY